MIADILSIFALLLILCIIPTAWLVYKRKIKFLNGVFLGTFLFLMSFGCSVYGVYLLEGYSPIDKMLSVAFESMEAAFRSLPGITTGDLTAVMKIVETVKEMYVALIPSIIVLFCLGWSYILLMISKGILALLKKDVSGFARFCDFKMPKSTLFIAALTYILHMIFDGKQIGFAFLNFSSIILSVTTFCGISVIDYKLRNKIRFSVLRFIVIILLIMALSLVFGDGTGIFMFIGMFDSVFNFRRNGKNNDTDVQ